MEDNISNACMWKVLEITNRIKISSAILIAIDVVPALLTVLLNVIFMVTLIKTRILHTPSNVFLGALCITDFLVGFIAQPIFIAYQFSIVTNSESHTLRVLLRYVVCVVSGLSFIFASFVTVDRYVAICHPFVYQQKATCKRYLAIASFAGICYTAIAAVALFRRNYPFEGLVMCYLILTFVGIIVSYTRIYRIALKKSRTGISMGTLNDEESQEKSNYEKKEKDKTYIIAIILFFLLLCYLPFAAMSIAAIIWRRKICKAREATLIASLWVGCLVLINSCINPIIYFIMCRELRTAARKIFLTRKENAELSRNRNNNECKMDTEKTREE